MAAVLALLAVLTALACASAEEEAVCQAIGCCGKGPINAQYEWAKVISADNNIFNTKNTNMYVDQESQTLFWNGHLRRKIRDVKVDLMVMRQNEEDGSWVELVNKKNANMCFNTPRVVKMYATLLGMQNTQPNPLFPAHAQSMQCPVRPGMISLNDFTPEDFQLSRNFMSGRHLVQFNYKTEDMSFLNVGFIATITCLS